jgi:hypothetical protein
VTALATIGGFAVRGLVHTWDLVRPADRDELSESADRVSCIVGRIEDRVPAGARIAIESHHLVAYMLNSRLFDRYELVARDASPPPETVVAVEFAPFGACAETVIDVRTP